MEEIYNILEFYSKNGMLLDKKAIFAISQILLLEYNIQNDYNIKVYNNIIFSNSNRLFGSFDTESIKFYLSRLKKYINSKEKQKTSFILEQKLSNYEHILYNNIMILRIFMHEFEHLLQHENKIDYYSITEKKLLNIENNFIDDLIEKIIKNNDSTSKRLEMAKYYKKILSYNYNISFSERITDIYAIEKTNKMFEDYGIKDSYINQINKLFLLRTKMKSYSDFGDSPTKRFFENIGKQYEFNQIKIDNITEDEKLRYGLVISDQEYVDNKVKLMIAKRK